MAASATPLVSVVIPVYNGGPFIANAIRSVLAQTYPNFDLTIADNCSTDNTAAIVAGFAQHDPRVRLHRNAKFLNVVENHNNAFTLISPDATYVKILGADDWFFPHCLEELVKVAEAHPTVGMVTSYVLAGRYVAWDGLPYPSTFMTGRDVCRLRLLKNIKVFGGPSASLLRASVVRERVPFYNPLNYHGDTEAYLELLQRHDFGYVHQVLSYDRKDEDSRTTAYLKRVNSYPAADLDEITKFGPIYLTPAEHAVRLRETTRNYYWFLAKNVFEFRRREFWHYHRTHFKAMGYPLEYGRLTWYSFLRFIDLLLNPKRTIGGALRRLGQFAAR